MKASVQALNLIKYYEGFVPEVYNCPAGYPTVGYGHKLKKGERFGTITKAFASALLEKDVQEVAKQVTKVINANTTQHQFDALVTFTFNLGIANLNISTLLQKHNRGSFVEAGEEFPRWKFATVKGKKIEMDGLINRREAERRLYETGRWEK